MNGTNGTNGTNFAVGSQSFFVTYPKCDADKQAVLEFFTDKGADKIIVAQEKHADGTPHLHVYAHFPKKKKASTRTFDFESFHPNIQSCRNMNAVIKYIKKDGDFLEHNMSVAAYEKAKQSHISIICQELLLGTKTLREATDEHPELLMRYGTLKKNLQLYRADKASEERAKQPVDYPTDKKRHMWIYGPTNCGKSTKLETILANYPGDTFQIPYNNDWDGYLGERILWADEYKDQLGIQDLNSVCNGGAKVNTKGGSVTLHKKPQLFIASNYAPDEAYFKEQKKITDSLYTRFNLIPYNYNQEQ